MLRVFVAVLFGVQALFNSEAGHAQGSYRSRPVKVICGFPAGMSADIMARLYGQKLSEKFGQQFVVENRLGASGNLAAEAVARSDADGYTLLLGTVANSISASAFKNISHEVDRVFAAREHPLVNDPITEADRALPDDYGRLYADADFANRR